MGYDATSRPPSDIIFIASIPSIVQKEKDAFKRSIEKNKIIEPSIIKNRTKALYRVQFTFTVTIP